MKKAEIIVFRHGYEKEYVEKCEIMLSSDDLDNLIYYTPENLRKYLHDNCVGKTTTLFGDETYFIPHIKIGTLEFSIQNNYRLWNLRDKENWKSNGHLSYGERNKIFREICAQTITEEEFDETIDDWLDVAMYNERDLFFMGQMRVEDVSTFMRNLAVELHETLCN